MSALPRFGGETYNAQRDGARLTSQLQWVRFFLVDVGGWWTLADLTACVSESLNRRCTEASISARIRDLRKSDFDGREIQRRNIAGGLFEYRAPE